MRNFREKAKVLSYYKPKSFKICTISFIIQQNQVKTDRISKYLKKDKRNKGSFRLVSTLFDCHNRNFRQNRNFQNNRNFRLNRNFCLNQKFCFNRKFCLY